MVFSHNIHEKLKLKCNFQIVLYGWIKKYFDGVLSIFLNDCKDVNYAISMKGIWKSRLEKIQILMCCFPLHYFSNVILVPSQRLWWPKWCTCSHKVVWQELDEMKLGLNVFALCIGNMKGGGGGGERWKITYLFNKFNCMFWR